jgi:hypothetical protein
MSQEPPAQVPRRDWRQATKNDAIRNAGFHTTLPLHPNNNQLWKQFRLAVHCRQCNQRHTNLASNASNGNAKSENKPA